MRRATPWLLLVAGLLVLVALPERLVARWAPWPRAVEPLLKPPAVAADRPPPPRDPQLRPLALLERGLLQRLRTADRRWIPRREPLPGGGSRYIYRRRHGDPALTIPQLKALIAHPPDHAAERQAIVSLLQELDRVGAALSLSEPIKPGAAAEWDPQLRTLRIRPDVVERGSVEFARVLNHEAVHVAQSCAAGALRARPRPLGVLAADPARAGQRPGAPAETTGPRSPAGERGIEAASALQNPVYADAGPLERRLETEAYALQNRLGLAERLVRLHCRDGRSP